MKRRPLLQVACLIVMSAAVFLGAAVAAAQEAGKDDAKKVATEVQAPAAAAPANAPDAPSSAGGPSAEGGAGRPDAAAEPAPQPGAPPSPPPPAVSYDDRWHVTLYPFYLWMPGLQGTVGAGGLSAPVDASFSDIVHNLKFGYMGAVDVRKKRVGVTFDLDYLHLSDSRSLSAPSLFSGFDADVKVLILTPELYYRVAEGERGTVDVLGGFRFFHMSHELQFLPGILPGTTRGASDNWATPVFGMRFRLNLDKEKKWYMPVMGDAGGPILTWQIMGGVGRDFKKRYTMFAGYRHMAVDRRNEAKVFDVRMSGPLLGFGVKWGVEETVPPSATCSAEPAEVMAGEPVRVTATAANFAKGRTLTYSWTSTGGKVAGGESVGTVDTTGLAPGSYTTSAQVIDNKKKSATCSASFTVKEPPRNPPHLSCSANPPSVKSGESSTINCTCNSPDNRSLSYTWNTNAGTLSGSGASEVLDTAGLPSGPVSVGTTCADDRGLSDSTTTTVNVEAPPPPPQAAKMAECAFPSKSQPGRVDNTCKAVLDDVALRLQREADAKAVIVGQADSDERQAAKLALQRANNSKTYLVKEKGIDASRIETRAGSEGGRRAEYILVPPGVTY